MSDENSAISVTLKAGPGYEAPWVVVRGDNPESVNSRLEGIAQLGVLATATKVAVELQGVYAAGKGVGAVPTQVQGSEQQSTWQAGPTSPAPSTPVPQAAAAQAPEPACVHGTRKWVAGQSAKGTWQAWMCPTPKGAQDKCEPLWSKPDGTPK